jgi:DNA-binding transcriptional regulator/RsmH inhibitor MraZ
MGFMLRGSALAKLDDKGRLKLPSAFRSVIEPKYGNEFFVSSLSGDSVRIYPLQVFAEVEQRLLVSSNVEPAITKLRNTLNYFGQRAVIAERPADRPGTGAAGGARLLRRKELSGRCCPWRKR